MEQAFGIATLWFGLALVATGASERGRVSSLLLYLAGKAWSYAVLGALAGALGHTIVRLAPLGIGARALAIDQLDRLLLVTNQGSGEVVLIDLVTNQIAGRINGVRSENDEDDDKHDDHGDRERAANTPAISSLTPNKMTGPPTSPSPFQMTIDGKNFTGATEVVFLDPDSLPGKGRGNGNSGNHGRGPAGRKDPAFTVTILGTPTATRITVSVAVAAGASKGDRVVQVMTPNGESSSRLSTANTFTLQ